MVNGRRGNKGIEIKRPSALLEGGPRGGWGYYVDELQQVVRMEAEINGREFWYRPTGRKIPHPRTFGEVKSEVWEYVVELDPFAPKPPPPPTRLELVLGAVGMLGSRGGQLAHIVPMLPAEFHVGLQGKNSLAVRIAPLVWYLVHQGLLEQSDHVYDAWYRMRRVAHAEEPDT